MEDRLAKVRAELERRVRFHAESSDPLASAYVSEDNVILSFIDSMQEEPTIPEMVDEHWWEMLGEETVSEDLEKAASMYMEQEINEGADYIDDVEGYYYYAKD